MDKEILMCSCCRNINCDFYTILKGYLFCSYCFDDYMNENLGGKEPIEIWMQKHYNKLQKELGIEGEK